MPTTRPAFFVSAAEARFLSQKLPEGREGGRAQGQEGHQEPPPGRIIWNWEEGRQRAKSEGEGEHA